ncbi:hypothetical protein ACSS6W_010118 [Trichoderma asperelloides]
MPDGLALPYRISVSHFNATALRKATPSSAPERGHTSSISLRETCKQLGELVAARLFDHASSFVITHHSRQIDSPGQHILECQAASGCGLFSCIVASIDNVEGEMT